MNIVYREPIYEFFINGGTEGHAAVRPGFQRGDGVSSSYEHVPQPSPFQI